MMFSTKHFILMFFMFFQPYLDLILLLSGIHYLGQLHENSMLKVALDQITEGQLQFAKLEQHYDTVFLGQPDQRRWDMCDYLYFSVSSFPSVAPLCFPKVLSHLPSFPGTVSLHFFKKKIPSCCQGIPYPCRKD